MRTTRPSIADSELFDGAAPKLKAPPAGALATNVGAADPDPNTKGDGAELRALGSAGGAIPEAPEPTERPAAGQRALATRSPPPARRQ